MRLLIIIPTYNEALNIIELIGEIKKVYDCDILIVDDNSPDNTAQIVKDAKIEGVNILKRQGKLGLASAYIDGFKLGQSLGYDAFIQMDADFSHNPKYLPDMIEYLKDNDFVVASRNVEEGGVSNWPFFRKIISKCGSLYARTILNCPIKDLTGGFNGYKFETLNKIDLDNIISNGYSFQIEMKYKAHRAGLKYKEFPIIFEDRKLGNSKMNSRIFIEAMLNVVKLKFKVR